MSATRYPARTLAGDTVPANPDGVAGSSRPPSWAHREGGGRCAVCDRPTLRRTADGRLLHATCAAAQRMTSDRLSPAQTMMARLLGPLDGAHG